MAICKYCELEMNEADGCVKLPVQTIDGDMDPVVYGTEVGIDPEPRIIVATTAAHYRDIITMMVVIGNNALAPRTSH